MLRFVIKAGAAAHTHDVRVAHGALSTQEVLMFDTQFAKQMFRGVHYVF